VTIDATRKFGCTNLEHGDFLAIDRPHRCNTRYHIRDTTKRNDADIFAFMTHLCHSFTSGLCKKCRANDTGGNVAVARKTARKAPAKKAAPRKAAKKATKRTAKKAAPRKAAKKATKRTAKKAAPRKAAKKAAPRKAAKRTARKATRGK
jgi:hypothetical protein